MPAPPYGSSFTAAGSPPAQFGSAFTPSVPDKAFSGYHRPSSVSPYYSLYTTNTRNGTIDPYMTGVKPYLDQLQQNQQVNTDINTLQNQTNQLTAPDRNANGIQTGSSGYQINYSTLPNAGQ